MTLTGLAPEPDLVSGGWAHKPGRTSSVHGANTYGLVWPSSGVPGLLGFPKGGWRTGEVCLGGDTKGHIYLSSDLETPWDPLGGVA